MRLPIDGTIHPHRSSKEARRSRPPGAWPIKLPLRLPPPGRPDLVERQPELLAHHLTAAGDIERTVTKPPCAAAEEPMVRRLSPGGNRIRTVGPAPAKGSSGRCQSETSARKAQPLTGSGPRRQCLSGAAPHSLSLRGGTGVRRFPAHGVGPCRPGAPDLCRDFFSRAVALELSFFEAAYTT